MACPSGLPTALPTTMPATVDDLLLVPTPQAWLDRALQEPEILLIDHANCEKKAASTALSLMYRYVDSPTLLHKMSRLAREELRHFEQVLSIMQQRSIEYIQLSSSRYAGALHDSISRQEPQRRVDTLLLGALIEARSFERFRALAPLLDEELKKFYQSLLISEERHFRDYIALAHDQVQSQDGSVADLERRLVELAVVEKGLIESPDEQFRFHSGVPVVC